MNRVRILSILALTGLVIPSGTAQQTRRAPRDPAEWVPAEALVYVGVSDVQELWADFKKMPDYQALRDRDAPSSETKVAAALIDKLQKGLAELLKVSPQALKNPLAGPLAFYVVAPPGGGPDDVKPGLIASVSDTATMQAYFDTMVARLKQAADKYEAVSAGGQTIHVFSSAPDKEKPAEPGAPAGTDEPDFAEDENAADARDQAAFLGRITRDLDQFLANPTIPGDLAACLAGDRLIVTGSAEQVRALLAREKQGRSLAESDDYRALLQELKPAGELRFLVNLPQILELTLGRGSGAGDSERRRWLSVLGVDGLRSVVGHLRLGSSKLYESKFELLFLMSGERSGLARLLSLENQPVEAPESVSADAAICTSINLDPGKLLDDILRMIAAGDAQAGERARQELEQLPAPDDGPPINLRRDLLDHLNGPLTFSMGIARPYGPGSVRVLLGLRHRNRDALVRLLSRVPGVTSREVRGNQLYEYPMMPGLVAVITSDHILAGSQSAVDAALSGDAGAGLAEDAQFRRGLKAVPKEAWWLVYLDERKLLEGLSELAKGQGEGDALTAQLLALLRMQGVDLSDGVATQKMIQYARASILTLSTTPQGLRLTAAELKPPEPEK